MHLELPPLSLGSLCHRLTSYFCSDSFIIANAEASCNEHAIFCAKIACFSEVLPFLCLCGLFSSANSVTTPTTPTTSTQVFYISVSVCCIVIFLVAIILAILHLHSMKRVEMEDRFVCFKVCPQKP